MLLPRSSVYEVLVVPLIAGSKNCAVRLGGKDPVEEVEHEEAAGEEDLGAVVDPQGNLLARHALKLALDLAAED